MTQPVDYRPMWSDLGLDLDKHDALLSALSEGYAATFLSRKNRPEGMRYFDFVMSEVHGLRIQELVDAKAGGRIVVGSFCVFVPEELILAVDGISVGLCAGAEFGFDEAEKIVPRNTCALIKSAFGFLKERVCPYLAASDAIVGENTCDGKKKSYEYMDGMVDRFYAMDIPQVKNDSARALLAAEYRRFAAFLEELSGKKITADSLAKGIETVNAKRAAMDRLNALRQADPAPISGLDALLVSQVYFYDDPERFTGSVNKLCDELEQRVKDGAGVADKGAPRVLVSGCPMAVPNWKLHTIVEGAGAIVVGEESCVGRRGQRNAVSNKGATVREMLEGIVDRYFAIDCAIFAPNPERLGHVREMIGEQRAGGVIHYALQFCTPYLMEAGGIEKSLKQAGAPVLTIDTDYGQGDLQQLTTRVGAFVEQL